jgi:hypothetical protein
MKSKNIIKLSLIIFIVFMPFVSIIAQPQGPGGGGGPSGCWPPGLCVPIDGGISFLIAAGLGLGAKKILDARKN